jgi:DNA-binding transcriptional regulator YbjK
MAEHGAVKLIPPAKVMAAELERQLAAAVRSSVIDRILREAKAEQQISKALRKIKRPSGPAFIKGIKAMFAADDKQPWRDFIRDAVRRLASGVRT